MSTMLDMPNNNVKHKKQNTCDNVRMSLQKRINTLLTENQKIKAIDIAKFVGVSRGAVSDWVNGKTKTIAGENAFKVAKLFNVNPEWVQNGTGSKYKTEVATPQPAQQARQARELSNTLKDVPLISWIMAGNFCETPGQFTLSDYEELLPRPIESSSKSLFALTVRGDSMDIPDGYREGEIVYIDPEMPPTPGNDVLARTVTGVTLKRYKEDEDGPYLLQLNGNKIIRPKEPWYVCGVVIFSGRKR